LGNKYSNRQRIVLLEQPLQRTTCV